MRFTLILSLLLAIVAVVVALQNPEPIPVQLGPFAIEGSTALVLLLTFVLGVLVGILAMMPSRLKSRKEVRTLKKQTTEPGPASSTSDVTDYPMPSEPRS